MPDVTDISTTKTRLHRLLQSATPAPVKDKPAGQQLSILLILCLLGTMIPLQAVMTFFSLTTVTIALALLISVWTKRQRIGKHIATLLIALTATSVLSGCAQAFTFQTPAELLTIANENDYKIHTLRKIGIFGLGLDQATVETAQAESQIKKIRAIQIDKGYGLVSIITITIAGEG